MFKTVMTEEEASVNVSAMKNRYEKKITNENEFVYPK